MLRAFTQESLKATMCIYIVMDKIVRNLRVFRASVRKD